MAERVAPGPPCTEHGLTVQPSRSRCPNTPVWSTAGAPGTVPPSGSQEGARRPQDVLLSTWRGSGAPFLHQLPPGTACFSLLRGLWNWAEQVPRAPEALDKNVTGSFPRPAHGAGPRNLVLPGLSWRTVIDHGLGRKRTPSSVGFGEPIRALPVSSTGLHRGRLIAGALCA